MKIKKQYSKWTQIVIRDPNALPGKSIHDLVAVINDTIKINYVVIYNLEGAGTNLLPKDLENPVLNFNDFMERVLFVTQFDWGDFFFFNYKPSYKELCYMDYDEIIDKTVATVRAVDDTYMYVNIPADATINKLEEIFDIESKKSDSLEKLDYPE